MWDIIRTLFRNDIIEEGGTPGFKIFAAEILTSCDSSETCACRKASNISFVTMVPCNSDANHQQTSICANRRVERGSSKSISSVRSLKQDIQTVIQANPDLLCSSFKSIRVAGSTFYK